MIVLLVLGSIFTLGGFGIYFLGKKHGVPNSLLWGLFPILHGFHEFAEYLLDEYNVPLIVERFEILFAVGSSIILVVAVIEYLGSIARPYGKLSGIFAFLIIIYYSFVPNDEAIEELENQTFSFGVLSTNFFRFFFGVVLVLFAILMLLYSYYLLRSQQDKAYKNEKIRNITISSTVLLSLFALFEGFTSENFIFVTLRGISAVFFLIVPAYVVFTNDLGLQILLITQDTGSYITGYNFNTQTTLDDDYAILTGNFIAAISSFSQRDKDLGGLSEITTTQGRYFINHKGEFIISLLTRNTNKNLETSLINFTNTVDKLVQETKGQFKIDKDQWDIALKDQFGEFY